MSSGEQNGHGLMGLLADLSKQLSKWDSLFWKVEDALKDVNLFTVGTRKKTWTKKPAAQVAGQWTPPGADQSVADGVEKRFQLEKCHPEPCHPRV